MESGDSHHFPSIIPAGKSRARKWAVSLLAGLLTTCYSTALMTQRNITLQRTMKAAKESPLPATEQETAWIPYGQWRRNRPHTAVGRIVVCERLWSSQLKNARPLFVYLPP